MKTLILSQIYNPKYNKMPDEAPENDPDKYIYLVEKVTNSITPQVGWPHLSAAQAEEYCNDEDWSVTITLPKG